MDKKKRGRRRLLFKCFRPHGVDDDDYRFDCYSFSPSLYPDDERSTTKKRLGRSFSGSLKAALSKSVKRLRSKKARKDSSRTSASIDSSPSRRGNVANTIQTKDESEDISRTSSAPSSLFSLSSSAVMTSSSSSSSSSSSISSDSRSNSLNLKQMNNPPPRRKTLTRRGSGKYCICIRPGVMRGGMVSFMVCLTCVVLWGKVFAILACTSTWLYYAPTCRHISDLDLEIINSYEYKKKVILQGFLDRNRSRYVEK